MFNLTALFLQVAQRRFRMLYLLPKGMMSMLFPQAKAMVLFKESHLNRNGDNKQ
jgi:hypothetical protein